MTAATADVMPSDAAQADAPTPQAGVFDPSEHPHRRYNPLLKTHVLVSPHRTKRPWLGQVDPPSVAALPEWDPKCYLCPRNERLGGGANPNYDSTYVFQNDFPALLSSAPPAPAPTSPFFAQHPASGSSAVLCFSPRHDLTLARMTAAEVGGVVGAWRAIWEGAQEEYVQLFENRGSMMGASNPHPHGQVWATSFVPTEPATVLRSLAEYHDAPATRGRNLLEDYARDEQTLGKGERIVVENADWLAVVPFWAVWPFETMILPRQRRIRNLSELTEQEQAGLADVLRRLLVKYDNLFSCSFPYSLGLHQTPSPSWAARRKAEGTEDPSQLHLLVYPPLLRSASVRKFLVGFELLAEAQRDLTPEQAAARLRACDDVHYLERLAEGK